MLICRHSKQFHSYIVFTRCPLLQPEPGYLAILENQFGHGVVATILVFQCPEMDLVILLFEFTHVYCFVSTIVINCFTFMLVLLFDNKLSGITYIKQDSKNLNSS